MRCLLLALALLAGVARAEDPTPYVLVNISETNCGTAADHTSAPWVGQRSLYIWICGGFNLFNRTEFGIATDLSVVDLIPRNGVVNVGTTTSPALIYPQCESFLLLAELVVEDSTGEGGSVCLVDSTPNQMNCTQDCQGALLANYYVGFSSDGTPPCEGLASSPGCFVVSVDTASWGMVKSRYR